ncbi:MAG: DUF3048 domain-containing protein [Clostridiales bacterium]|nr:DUF3048 domain-containing protein [Clostridiales bacterium]
MKNKAISIVLIIGFLLAAGGVGAYVLWPEKEPEVVEEPESSVSEESSSEESSSESSESEEPESSESSSEESSSESSKDESSKKEEKKKLAKDEAYSQLTGLVVSKDVYKQRPVAVSINNHVDACPQSNLNAADIVYEVMVEGSITRYVAVFQDYMDLEKIGSIRSARRYFLDFAMDQSAVLAHFGQDPDIVDTFYAIGCPHLNGLEDAYHYWRSTDRVAPHNVYTTGKDLADAMDKYGYGATMEEAIEDPMFKFYRVYEDASKMKKERKALSKSDDTFSCKKLSIPGFNSSFTYNKDTKMYERTVYGEKQIDAETKERTACKNIILQFTDVYDRGDDKGHLDIDTIGEGDGYYICQNLVVPVHWVKEGQYETTHYYLENGDQLVMVPGKTWICVLSNYQEYTIE